MNKVISIHPSGGKLVCEMLSSCGNRSCEVVIQRLRKMKVSKDIQDFSVDGRWLKPVFGNLQKYANEEGIVELHASEVARYFGGKHHINDMIPKAFQATLGIEMGLDAGLVLDVLLPLTNGRYENSGHVLEFTNFVKSNPKERGVFCYHRGLVVSIDLKEADITQILKEQSESKEFMVALARLKSPVKLPENFITTLKICLQ